MALNITFYDGIRYHRMDFINRDKDFFGNGIVNISDFPSSFPGGMQISLGSGTAWVDGYRINNDSTSSIPLTVPAADPTNSRIDIVQIGHDDINGVASVVIKKGVAATSPVEPAADPNYLKLYAITVPANATSISSSNVTDRRQLVPLNVSGTQINMQGAAGPNQTNNFTLPQQFTATNSSIEATQIVLGQTNNVNAPASQIYLASANAAGVGMDAYGNLLPINPSSVTTGSSWSVSGKGGNKDFTVFTDGTHKVQTKNNTLDDGNGNATFTNAVTVGSLKFANAQGIYTDVYGNFLTPSAVTAGSYWNFQDKTPTSVFKIWVDGTKKIATANNTLDDGSGNMTIKTLNFSNATAISFDQNGNAVAPSNSPAGAGWNVFDKNALSIFRVALDGTKKVSTSNNTLDDGSGNMVLPNNTAIYSKNTSGTNKTMAYIDASNVMHIGDPSIQLYFQGTTVTTNRNMLDDGNGNMTLGNGGTLLTTPFGTATSGQNYASGGLKLRRSYWNGSAAVNGDNYFQVSSSGTINLFNEAGISVLSANQSNAVSTRNNVLDDGSGNLLAAGTITAGSGLTSSIVVGGQSGTNPYIQAKYNGTVKSQFVWQIDQGSLYADVSGSFVIRNAPNTGTAIFTVSNSGSVATPHMTLDDGSGNMTIGSTLTVNSDITVKGSVMNRMVNASIEHGSTTTVNTPYIDFHSSGNNIDYDSRIIASGGTASNGSGTLQMIGKITTNANTLDDGTGNMTVNGAITLPNQNIATSGGDVWSPTISFNSSHWNGSAAVKYTAYMQADNTGGFYFASNGSGSNTTVFQVSNSGLATMGNGSTIKGTAAGNANYAFLQFVQSNGTTRQGFVGKGDNTNGDILLAADTGNVSLYTTTGGYGLKLSQSNVLTSKNNTLDDGSGGTHFVSTMVVDNTLTANAATNYISSLRVTNASNITYLQGTQTVGGSTAGTLKLTGLNGVANTVQTYNNTLDDSNGNMTVSGTVTSSSHKTSVGTSTGGNLHYLLQTGSSLRWGIGMSGTESGSNAGSTFGIWSYDDSGNTIARPLSITRSSSAVSTKNNTLDDGSGNAGFTGAVSVGSIAKTGTASDLYVIPASGHSVGFVNYAQNAWGIRVADGTNPSTYTNKNTLDDGSGNMTVTGYIKSENGMANISGTTTASGFSYNAYYANGAWNATDSTKSSLLVWNDSSQNEIGLWTASAATTPSFTKRFAVNTSGKVFTPNNTLDDGSGNLSTSAMITSGTKVQYGPSASQGQLSYGTGVVTLESLSANTTIQIKPSGTGTLQLNPNLATSVTTRNSVLDDGAGNMTVYGSISIENWTNITLQNGWVAYAGTPAFYKNKFGEVRVKGIIKNGTTTNGTVLFTLPAGYRPKETKYAWGDDGNLATKRLQINPDGTVIIPDGCNNSFLIIDSINFLGEQ